MYNANEKKQGESASSSKKTANLKVSDYYIMLIEYIYKLLYLLGVKTFKTFKRFFNVLSNVPFYSKKYSSIAFSSIKITFSKKFSELRKDYEYEITDFHINLSKLKSHLVDKKGFTFEFRNLFYNTLKPLRMTLNYILPVVAIVVLGMTMNHFETQTYALSVEYSGEHIGYIENESVFNNAKSAVDGRFIGSKFLQPEDKVPIFTLEVIDNQELSTVDQITDEIILASGNEIKQADGLYIDGEFIGAAIDGDAILASLDDYKQDYQYKYPNQTVSFVNKVELKSGLYPVEQLKDINHIEETIQTEKKSAQTYRIKEGDSPSAVAQSVGMPTAELIKNNPDVIDTFLIDQELILSVAEKRLTIQGTERLIYEEDIPFDVETVEDANVFEGVSQVVSSGEKGLSEITADITYINGVEQGRTIIGSKVLTNPLPQILSKGTKKPLGNLPSVGSNQSFLWPVDGGKRNLGLWGYPGHTGLDILAPYASGVRASAAGKVVASGWQGGYGNCVIIDHGQGVQTLYGHNSSLDVAVGQYVNQGDLIARIGSTGNSTANHSHFEIRMNGQFMDPTIYIGNSYRG